MFFGYAFDKNLQPKAGRQILNPSPREEGEDGLNQKILFFMN